MSKSDISLQTILGQGRSRLPGLLGYHGNHVGISADIRTVWGDKVGFLALANRARNPSLVQIEMQATRDPNLTTRMLTLLSAIRSWVVAQREFEEMWPSQTVVYVGSKRWKPKAEIREFNLRYSHGFVDAREIDPEPLLESDNLGDVAFAVLCRDGKGSAVRKALDRIAAAPATERTKALTTLSRLSDLRGAGERVRSEIEKLGFSTHA
jgi:hypothetical protein